MISLEDEKSRKLGEAISNPSCKKIINLLAEKELSATEISRKLKIQMSALDYNLKKLIDSGIIEKSKHFWSVKGKKIPTYRVVNKVIVIQPKQQTKSSVYSKLKGISFMLCVASLLTALVAILTRQHYVSYDNMSSLKAGGESLASGALATSSDIIGGFLLNIQPWMWFAFGALIVMIIILIWNWKKL